MPVGTLVEYKKFYFDDTFILLPHLNICEYNRIASKVNLANLYAPGNNKISIILYNTNICLAEKLLTEFNIYIYIYIYIDTFEDIDILQSNIEKITNPNSKIFIVFLDLPNYINRIMSFLCTCSINSLKKSFIYLVNQPLTKEYFIEEILKYDSNPHKFLSKYNPIKVLNLSNSDKRIYLKRPDSLTLLSLPIKWNNDPYTKRQVNSNWLHNLNKLSILANLEKDIEFAYQIICDYQYFNLLNFNYYHAYKRYADHATSERIYNVSKIYFIFKKNKHKKGMDICLESLKTDSDLLLSPDVYTPGTNHGLMADLALLTLYNSIPGIISYEQMQYVVKRGIETYLQMFTENGITRENSVSYQEWNLYYAFNFLNILTGIEEFSEFSARHLNILLTSSKIFLSYALKQNATYFPVGDSFRNPKVYFLQRCFPEMKDNQITSFLKAETGLAYWKEGFGSYKNIATGIQFFITCGRQSDIHKHNDELSFCISYNDIDIFDECGYSDLLDEKQKGFLASENAHSTIILHNLPWSSKKYTETKSLLNCDKQRKEFLCHHNRITGYSINRSIRIFSTLKFTHFFITDNILGPEIIATHRFILGKDIIPEVFKRFIILHYKNNIAGKICYKYNSDVKINNCMYIGENHAIRMNTKIIDIIDTKSQMEFLIKIYHF